MVSPPHRSGSAGIGFSRLLQVRRELHRGKYAAKRRRPLPQLVTLRHVRHGIDTAMSAGLIIRWTRFPSLVVAPKAKAWLKVWTSHRVRVEGRPIRCEALTRHGGPPAWNGSWNGWPRNPSAISASGAVRRAVCAGSGGAAEEHASRKAPLACSGSTVRGGSNRRCSAFREPIYHFLSRRDTARQAELGTYRAQSRPGARCRDYSRPVNK